MLRLVFSALAGNKPIRAFSERTSLGRRLSSRFVAGLTIEDALRVAEELNGQGLAVSLDALGESVTSASEAENAAGVYRILIDAIQARGLNANVSLKLTQMGLDLDPEMAEGLVARLVAQASDAGTFVRIDMEGSAYTARTLAIAERLHAGWPQAVGTVLQASLFRTVNDARRLIDQGIPIRLCKGAYREPATIAFHKKSDVDRNYTELMRYLTGSSVFCGIATHDEAIVRRMCDWVEAGEIAKHRFEFQMLYGIRRDLQKRLAGEGYGVRVYVPFGEAWYPYFMRRLAERPANVLFLAKNLLKK